MGLLEGLDLRSEHGAVHEEPVGEDHRRAVPAGVVVGDPGSAHLSVRHGRTLGLVVPACRVVGAEGASRPNGPRPGSPTGGPRGPASPPRRPPRSMPRAAKWGSAIDVGHVVHRRGRGLGFLERGEHLGQGPGRHTTRPSGRRTSSRAAMRPRRSEVGSVAEADELHHAGCHGTRRRRTPPPTARLGTAPRARGARSRASPSRGGAGGSRPARERPSERSHALEQRLQEVDVHDLTHARPESGHRGERRRPAR